LRLITLMAVGWAWVAGGILHTRPTCEVYLAPAAGAQNPRSLRAAWLLATLGLLPLVAVGGDVGPQVANACCVLMFTLRRGAGPLWCSVLVIAINASLSSATAAPWLFVANVFIGWGCP
jgi:hypothetical protein